jgi:hypothetical protein
MVAFLMAHLKYLSLHIFLRYIDVEIHEAFMVGCY